MSLLTTIILLVVLAFGLFMAYKLIAFKKHSRKSSQLKFERIRPLYDKLERGETINGEEVAGYAKNILTRGAAYLLLKEYHLTGLFPQEYYSIEKAGESNLANWLEFPTELDACPDEMEYIKQVSFDFDGQNNLVHYHVYKFRVNEPHWAAEDGWILGIVGPYFDDSQPYDHPHSTFSRLSSRFETTSPDEEAKWVHENISKRRR